MTSSVMILGAGTMQIPAILAAKELGLYVLVADGCQTAPGISLADEFMHVDLKNREGLLSCAQEFSSRNRLIGVFTAGTDFSANVAYIAQRCGLPGHSYQAALNATNKARMRACFQKHGVPGPRFLQISSLTELGVVQPELQSWGRNGVFSRVVVKPVDNMGSRGVVLVDDIKGLLEAVESALSYSATGQVIIEEFMDGPELSLDALVFDGDVHICGIADRHIFYPPYFVERGHTLWSNLDQSMLDEVVHVFKQAVQALGLSHGAAKGDMKVTSSGVKVGEIAARLSGGYMSGWTYPYASGVNLTKNALQLAIGAKPGSLQPRMPLHTSAEWSFISIPGKVQEILYANEAKNVPYIKEIFMRVIPQQEVNFPRNNVEKCGNFIAVHSKRTKAEEAAKQAAKTIFIRLEKGNAATASFLFKEDWPKTEDLFNEGYDINGHTLKEMQEKFRRITGCAWPTLSANEAQRFTQAWQRGGLQGAVWFYDTYLRDCRD